MCPTTKTNRERARPPSNNTHKAVHHKDKKRMIVSFHHQNKTKRGRERRCAPPPKQKERARAKQQDTHKVVYLQYKKWIVISATRWGARTHGRRAKVTMLFTTKGKKLTLHHSIIKTKRKREDVFHHHQNKMRESTGQAPTAHTKPFITTTKWGGRTQSGGSNPATQSTKSHASPNKKRFIMYQGEIIIISFDY